jgi:peptide/nickel transport system substrate-binding protein
MRTPRAVAVVATAVTLLGLAAACTKNTGSDSNTPQAKLVTTGIATNPAQSQGPAAPIKGAKKGGTLTTIQESDFGHLDPQRVYVSNASALDQMLCRTLTMLKQDPKTGNNVLVGDLATNTGTDVNGDGKTWRYTLKKGLYYEDGSPITAKDVAYAVARSFSPDIADGPHYIQQWLTGTSPYNKNYKGPYNGGSTMPPGVTVSGRSITFHLQEAAPDFPYAASWGTTSPIPQSQDSNPQKIDQHPFSSGPYKIQSYERGTKLVAVRNKYWRASTDPIRHNYIDELDVVIGPAQDEQTNRMIADNGDDEYAVSIDGVSADLTPKVTGDPSLKPRELAGFLPYAGRLDINTQRVKDVNVRKALNYAYPRSAYIKAIGGLAQAQPSHQIMSPTVAGWKNYNAYPSAGDNGNVAKAKQLLNGQHPRLVYAYPNTAEDQKYATVVVNGLDKAGFNIVPKAIDKDNYYTLIEAKNNKYDMYPSNWGADWPSGSTVLPPLFAGSSIVPNGGTNTAYFSAKDINDEMARLEKLPVEKASKQWGDLDEKIMKKYAPCIPTFDYKELTLFGSKVHGVLLGQGNVGGPIFYDAWLG